MRRAFFFLGISSLVLAAFAFACGDDDAKDGGIDLPPRDNPRDGGQEAADTATPTSCKDLTLKVGEPAACDQCAKDKCCDEVLACTKSADCEALQQCLEPCAQDDLLCILTCQTQHPKGADLLQEVGACAQSRCKTECPSNVPDADIFGDF
ncbi:MAG: hypothetical protein KF819_15090 [Labilithrix sp.]|nr:hypothetical protein [Labilithrix sp.]